MTTRYATVFCGVTLPDGTPYTGQPVPVVLNTPTAFTVDGLTEIVRTAYATQTPTGFEITLPINDDIDPSGTTWKLRVARLSWTFQLTAAHAGQRVSLREVIVADPTNPNPISAGTGLPNVITPGSWTNANITVDAKGRVTAAANGTGGAGGGTVASVFGRTGTVAAAANDYTADQIADGTTNRLYTAAEKTKLAAITGTNTGDETTATIKTKLGVTTLSGSNTGDQTIPTSLPPNGAAGGDLTGTYPNPTLNPAGTALAAKAPLASPALTGTPTAPTATPGTNTTQIATTAFVAAAATNPTATGLLEGVPAVSLGHSFGVIQGSGEAANTFKTYFDRVQARQRCGTYTNHNVSNSVAGDVWFTASSWFTPGSGRAAYLLDATINDVGYGHGSTAGQQQYQDSMNALLWLLRSGVEVADSVGTQSGTWATVTDETYRGGSAIRTTAQNASVTCTVSGQTKVGVILYGTTAGATGGTASIQVDSGTATTINLNGRALGGRGVNSAYAYYPLVVPITLPDTGSHTLTITKSDAGSGAVTFDGLLFPSPAPPLVAVTKAVYSTTAGYARYPSAPTNADVDTFNGYLASIVASFAATDGSLVLVDPTSRWVAATMCSADGQHPNDLGMSTLADAVQAALATMTTVTGTNRGTGTITQTGSAIGAGAPAGAPSQVTGLVATTSTTTGGQAILSWTAPSASPAITDYIIQYRTTTGPGAWQTFTHTASTATTQTITGLTNGTSYDFHVAAINSNGTGTYSATVTGTVGTAYVQDSFNRANNAGALGTASDGGTWTVLGQGRHYISGSSYAASYQGANTNVGIDYRDAAHADVTVQATLLGTSDSVATNPPIASFGVNVNDGLVGRVTDLSNFWAARVINGQPYSIQKCVAGAFSTPTGGTSAVNPAVGDIVQLVLNGTTITLKVNGTQIAQVTGDSFNQTATKVGILSVGNASTGSTAYGAAWDDFVAF